MQLIRVATTQIVEDELHRERLGAARFAHEEDGQSVEDTHEQHEHVFEQSAVRCNPLRDVHPLEILVLLGTYHVIELGVAQLWPHTGIALVLPHAPKHLTVLFAALTRGEAHIVAVCKA